jgi:hypothetical protein
MKSKLAVVALALLVSLGLGASPASAHVDNPYAGWACGSTRPQEEYTLQHAHIAAMGVYSNGVSYVRGNCQAQAESRICFWVGESRSDGTNLVFGRYHCAG